MYSENYKGVPLGQIYRGFNKWDFDHLPPIENKRCHTVLYRLPVPKGLKHPPDPFESGSKWDQHHVRLPNSQYSEYKTECAVFKSDLKCISKCYDFRLIVYFLLIVCVCRAMPAKQ